VVEGRKKLHDDMVTQFKRNEKKDEEENPVCPGAGSSCVFFEHEGVPRSLTMPVRSRIASIPSNNIQKKKLYRTTLLVAHWARNSSSLPSAAVSRQSGICSHLILLWATSPNYYEDGVK
jgi:hypothetical protein